MTREERLLARILESLRETALPSSSGSGADANRAPARIRPPTVGPPTVSSPLVGPGDDAAVLAAPDGRPLLLTVDAAEDGVHFDRRRHSPEDIGRRAVAAAASDLAAMGGRPLAFLVSLTAPAGDPEEDEAALRVSRAASRRASEIGAPVVGGNLTAGARLALHVSVVGAMAPGVAPLLRSGARPGDGVFVSGPLGGAALGLEVLRRRRSAEESAGRSADDEAALRKHLDPEPRLALGEALAASGGVSAAMDLSDGLALDLHRLAEASRAGVLLHAERLPVARSGARSGAVVPDRVFNAALFGGEDYELLFTGADEAVLREAAAKAGEPPPIRIGVVVAPDLGVRIRAAGGQPAPLPRRGWDSLLAPTSG